MPSLFTRSSRGRSQSIGRSGNQLYEYLEAEQCRIDITPLIRSLDQLIDLHEDSTRSRGARAGERKHFETLESARETLEAAQLTLDRSNRADGVRRARLRDSALVSVRSAIALIAQARED